MKKSLTFPDLMSIHAAHSLILTPLHVARSILTSQLGFLTLS